MLTAVPRAQRTRLSASGIGLGLSRAMRSRHVSGAIMSLAPAVTAVGLAHLPFAGIGLDQPEHQIGYSIVLRPPWQHESSPRG